VIARGASILLAAVIAVACGSGGRAAPSAPTSRIVIASPSPTPPYIDVNDMMGAFPPTTFAVVTPDGVKGIALLNHAVRYTIPTEGTTVQVAAHDQSGRLYVLDTTANGARLRWFDAGTGSERASALIAGASPARARTPHSGLAVDGTTGIVYAMLHRSDGIAVERFDWFTLRAGDAVWDQFRCGDRLLAASGRLALACMDDPTAGLVIKDGDMEFKDTARQRLLSLDIADDGALSHRRVWADLGDGVPDGICIDADGAVWYADVPNRRCVRVGEGGDVLGTIELDRGCFACMLGGPDGRTLFIVAREWHGPDVAAGAGTGQVLVADAPAPHAGWP
jgi:hypothetical protein